MENVYKPPESSLRAGAIINARDAKMYKISAVGIATAIGGLFAGGLILSHNFRVLGKDNRAVNVLIYSGIGFLCVIGLGALIPNSWNIPSAVLIIPQVLAIHQYAKQQQEAGINAHIENGGGLESNWKAFGIGMLVVLAIVAVAAPIIFLLS